MARAVLLVAALVASTAFALRPERALAGALVGRAMHVPIIDGSRMEQGRSG